ncbi:MAG: transposase [Proteobacteria bacterium]|nr:transposase [Pseudomonadota bacterium]
MGEPPGGSTLTASAAVLDGVYRTDDAGPVFVEAPPPTGQEVQAVLRKIVDRVLRMLTRRGVLVQEQDSIYVADADGESDDARTLRPLQAASCVYRIAFGPRAGQKVLKLQGGAPQEQEFERELCADMQGFSLHAAVRCETDDRQGLERLCRYITRPALAYERVQCDAAGRVVLKLKTPWRDGTTHLVMSSAPPTTAKTTRRAFVPARRRERANGPRLRERANGPRWPPW